MIAWILLLVACGESPVAAAPAPVVAPADPTRPDLVLLLAPGLRADPPRLVGAEARFLQGLGGAPRLRFSAAYAQSSATFVSLGSLFTGRYATSIPLCGLFTDGVSAAETRTLQADAEASRLWCADIPPSVPTLPEVLGLYGYRTAFASAGVRGASLLARGFQETEEVPFDSEAGTDFGALGRWTAGWWAENADAPRLLVVAVADLQVVDRPPVLDRMGIRLLLDGAVPNPTRTDADPASVAAVYAQLAQETGVGLATVLGGLNGPRDRWVVATSTNGVSLVEPSGFWDMPVPVATTSYMLDRTARVPLVVFGPGEATGVPAAPGAPTGTVATRIVELLDLVPTFTTLAGAVPPAGIPGADLLAGPVDGAGDEFAYGEFGDTLLYREGRYEVLFRAFLHHGTVLDPQLDERLRAEVNQKHLTVHDVVDDPLQAENLALQRPEILQSLRQELIRVRSGPAAPPRETWDDPQRLWEIRMARSHGYW